MNIVMLANNACVFDARIRREAEALVGAGHRVTVLATSAEGVPAVETVEGVEYRRIKKVREIGKSLRERESASGGEGAMAARVKRLAFQVLRRVITPSMRHLFGYAGAYRSTIRALKPDVVHAHDLDTLLAGRLGASRAKAKLVYDAHELETDRNLPLVRFERTYRAIAERLLIRHCDTVITVSDSIARYLAERYRIRKPAVVLNAPVTRTVTDPERRRDLRADLGLSPDQPLALYVGGLIPGRGVDQAVRALRHVPRLHLAALGPRQDATAHEVIALAEALGVRGRLHVADPVPPEALRRYIESADVSLILLQNSCLNHLYCFPNKLLQSLLAGLPVVASRLVELERMVTTTGAGLIADETDPQAIGEAIEKILTEPARYRPTPALVRSLEASHGWQAQKKRLLSVYETLSRTEALKTAGAKERAESAAPVLSDGPS